ncbi:alpha-amylase family glycosyl hydrolase [Dyella tabacisoli]|uniref:Alpha-amylase n=1 Tax=Dyella tabacisoli TaxID=2282381 RepID=A0A369UR11_9GAMM|nr:alpha-amylase family glycosyl hydrolase [Dyella tabacisoli]RDD82951.1 DUF3459 domain-containing protein [Dyella tabacisoli]
MSRFRSFHWLAVLLALGLGCGPLCAARATEAPGAISSQASGVWYEIFVRSWYDSNGDGIGDLNGVTAKLDYLQQLGVSGIWLMPINPSPSVHGYDVTDYNAINPQYGSMQDFDRLLSEAHKRGIQVIIDLVINHTSDRHPWFQAALHPDDPHHDWYTWAGAKTDLHAISAAGGPAWHAVKAQSASIEPAPISPALIEHYLGDFTGAMPDLNYDHPAVRQEMIQVGQFWLRRGVDGFRLDAARHIYDDLRTDSDKPETVRKNVVWWTEFRQGMAAVKPDTYLVGEVAGLSTAQLAPYLQPLGSVFDFPLAEQLIQSARQERGDTLGAMLERTDTAYRQTAEHHVIDGYSGDAPFLSNHDQERVMSQLGGNPQHMRMAAAMLLTLPGRPFIYYGEELGMQGRKPDPNLREPMRWQRAADATGETRWKASTARQGGDVSVEAEQADPDSLWNFYARLIHWRMQISALRDGDLRSYPVDNPCIAAYERADADSRVLVVHNLSNKPQAIPAKAAKVLVTSKPGVALQDGQLTMPPYSSAVLQ